MPRGKAEILCEQGLLEFETSNYGKTCRREIWPQFLSG